MRKRTRGASIKSSHAAKHLSGLRRLIRRGRRSHFRNRGCHHNGPIPEMPMSMVSSGETVKLIEIRGGRRVRKRLADLGLNIGMSIRVVQGNSSGPMILAVKGDARLAVGRGVACKIIVSLQEKNAKGKII